MHQASSMVANNIQICMHCRLKLQESMQNAKQQTLEGELHYMRSWQASQVQHVVLILAWLMFDTDIPILSSSAPCVCVNKPCK